MLVAKNVLYLLVELGPVVLCKELELGYGKTALTDTCLSLLVKLVWNMVRP